MQGVIRIRAIIDEEGCLKGVKALGYFLDELILSSRPTGYWVQKEQ